MYLSHAVSEDTPAYGGRFPFRRTVLRSIAKGDAANVQGWEFTSHLGTHIDYPRHFDESGYTGDRDPASNMVFKRIVLVDYPASPGELIPPAPLEAAVNEDPELLLIRTGFEKFRNVDAYWSNNPGIHPDTARMVREAANIRMVGMDFISVSSWQHREQGRETHRILLSGAGGSSPVLPLEDMALSRLIEAPAEVLVAALRVTGSDGAPCTVLARLK